MTAVTAMFVHSCNLRVGDGGRSTSIDRSAPTLLVIGGGVSAANAFVPSDWSLPRVMFGVLPAHAQATNCSHIIESDERWEDLGCGGSSRIDSGVADASVDANEGVAGMGGSAGTGSNKVDAGFDSSVPSMDAGMDAAMAEDSAMGMDAATPMDADMDADMDAGPDCDEYTGDGTGYDGGGYPTPVPTNLQGQATSDTSLTVTWTRSTHTRATPCT